MNTRALYLKLRTLCIGLILASPYLRAADASVEKEAVALDADFATMPDFKDEKKVIYKFVIILTNVSPTDITVPSRSFDGEPCCWVTSIDERGVSYFVGEHQIGERRIVPSPLRFFPVTLHPGESTEIARYEVKIDVDKPLRWFSASLTVDEEYGKPKGWWTGDIHTKIDLKQKKPITPFF